MNQQQGFIGNTINNIKNNQIVLQLIYNTSTTIGIILISIKKDIKCSGVSNTYNKN